MTVVTSVPQRTPAIAPTLLLVLTGAVALRVGIAGPAGATSTTAGLVFAAVIAGTAAVAGARAHLDRRAVTVGLVGAAILLAPVVATANLTARPAAYLPWAAATTLVATAEDAFLRGALYDVVARRRGADIAVVVAAAAFALMHVPFYGWRALPLDLAVGLVLGGLRMYAGTWTAPAVAHVLADLGGWWFV